MFPGPGGGYGGYQAGGFGGQPGGYGGTPGGGYSGHGGQPGCYAGYGQPGVNPDIQQWFSTVDRDRSGKINSNELKAALVNAQGKNFSDTACQLMIGMFDRDKSGTIDVNEFQQLYTYINQWLNVFRTYDRDQSGHIEEAELNNALQQMGFRFSPDFVRFLIHKSDMDNHRQMSVDQFIVVCVQIQRFTEAFRQRDTDRKGVITLGFEDFLSVALSCSI
ncbi:EF-hand domain pair [Popillia japonica]|uniref:EF-hand domain pair n=1 Tax=Popillia japonica TaxID=7064 RepID=A0AAW1KK15_POPJA